MIAYRELEARFRRIGAIGQAISVLHWDTAAIMPTGGTAARAEQLATLRLIQHQHLVAPEIEPLLAEADSASVELGEWQRANLREMRRRWLHATAVPGALVEAESRACSECEAVWRRGVWKTTLPPCFRASSESSTSNAKSPPSKPNASEKAPTRRSSTNTSQTLRSPKSIACSMKSQNSCPI